MEDALRTKFIDLTERIADATHTISSLGDADEPSWDDVAAAHRRVKEIAEQYQALLTEVAPAERESTEVRWGRRVTDLRRLDATLPHRTGGSAVERAADAGQPFLLSRAPGKSIEMPRFGPVQRNAPTYRVGGETEAWCGPCAGLTSHHIVALVDGQPKQVICQACNAKHGYRTTPARSKTGLPASASSSAPSKYKPSRDEMEAQRRQDARFALLKELAEATNVRPFTTRERYKAGEIIQHPEHGRGKIESVLRGSILVRFRDGLKSLSLL